MKRPELNIKKPELTDKSAENISQALNGHLKALQAFESVIKSLPEELARVVLGAIETQTQALDKPTKLEPGTEVSVINFANAQQAIEGIRAELQKDKTAKSDPKLLVSLDKLDKASQRLADKEFKVVVNAPDTITIGNKTVREAIPVRLVTADGKQFYDAIMQGTADVLGGMLGARGATSGGSGGGDASASNQTSGAQKTQIVDAGGEVATVTGGKLDVNATVSVDPAGLATEAKQDTQITHLSAIETAVEAQQTDALTDAELRASPVPVSISSDIEIGAVELKNGTDDTRATITAANALKVDGSAVTQPVSAATLPLPSGAATSANQSTIIGHLDGVEGLLSTIDADTSTLAGAVSGTEMQVDVITMPTTTVQATNLDIRDLDAASDDITVHGDVGILDQLDLTNTNPLAVAIVDGTGDQITSFGGGVQYTEGDTDISITGTAIMWEDASDTMRAVSAAKPLPVDIQDSTLAVTQSGTWNITNISGTVSLPTGASTSVKQDTIIGHLDGVEGLLTDIETNTDSLAVVGGGTEATALRVTIANNSTGVLSVDDNGGSLTVDGTVGVSGTVTVDGSGVTQPVSNAGLTELAAAIGGTNPSQLDVYIKGSDVATGGTSAADDADFTDGTTPGTPAMGVYESSPTTVTDGDLGVVGITETRRLKTSATIDAALPTGDNNIGNVDVVSSVLPTGASTAANQTTIIGHLDGVEGLLTTIDADTGTIAGAVSGAEMQVDIVASLPAGTNAIGKLAANSGVDIGDVDVTSLPALATGTNYIGRISPPDVDVTTHTNYTKKYYTNAGAVTDGIIWSPASGKRWHVVSLIINVSAAATVTLEDDLAGGDSPVMKMELAANSGVAYNFTEKYPLASGEDAADLIVTTSAGNIYITAVGYEV